MIDRAACREVGKVRRRSVWTMWGRNCGSTVSRDSPEQWRRAAVVRSVGLTLAPYIGTGVKERGRWRAIKAKGTDHPRRGDKGATGAQLAGVVVVS